MEIRLSREIVRCTVTYFGFVSPKNGLASTAICTAAFISVLPVPNRDVSNVLLVPPIDWRVNHAPDNHSNCGYRMSECAVLEHINNSVGFGVTFRKLTSGHRLQNLAWRNMPFLQSWLPFWHASSNTNYRDVENTKGFLLLKRTSNMFTVSGFVWTQKRPLFFFLAQDNF
jgi:hypothetical protein